MVQLQKYFSRSYWYIAGIVSWVVFCVLLIFLFVEYRYFKQQAEKMIALQIEYKNHIMAAKRLLHVQNSDTVIVDEKKNTDDGSLIVNRSVGYTRDISYAFLEKEGLDDLLLQIPTQELMDYTDYVINENAPKKKKRSRTATKQQSAPKAVTKSSASSENTWVNRQTQKKGNRIFSWPIDPAKFWVSSLFGSRKRANGKWGFHYGLDMAAMKKTPVKAAARGVVVEVAYDAKGYGKTIVIAHNTQYKTRYAHLDAILVKRGQKVDRGQLIGRVGDTGAVRAAGFDGSHLHFEIVSFGKRVNPLYMLK